MKKSLVIFYSFEGNTKMIAETIANSADAEILELKPENEMKSRGFMKYFHGGKAAIMKNKPKLQPIDTAFDKYDILFIGTPVWAWTYAPPLNTFFSEHSLSNLNIALFCCHGGAKGAIFSKMKRALKGNRILGEIDFRDPLKKETEISQQRAAEWTKKILNTEG